jgi:hypothetical protein
MRSSHTSAGRGAEVPRRKEKKRAHPMPRARSRATPGVVKLKGMLGRSPPPRSTPICGPLAGNGGPCCQTNAVTAHRHGQHRVAHDRGGGEIEGGGSGPL